MKQQWKMQPGPLATRWAKDVGPDNAHPEYPRPQMVRRNWKNLNGLWELAVRPRQEGRPEAFESSILVPFPIESSLSGVMRRVDETQRIWYRRTFSVPQGWGKQTVLLHFGASDWETTVWVNGQEMGAHKGGYDPFTFDVTKALKPGGEQEVVVAVWDPTDAGTQPRGKQVKNPLGIWYTPTSGIWQTVWIEPVPEQHVDRLVITPDLDKGQVTVKTLGYDGPVSAEAFDSGRLAAQAKGEGEVVLKLENAKTWSPDSPFLYDLRIKAGDDQMRSYFGMRKVSLGKDEAGVTRVMLNNKPFFMVGPLDQGFWPDGLYTAPTDKALRYDIEVTKRLGFNMARKHVKVEPARWYYWCDKLGLLVWQDMPSGDGYIGGADPDLARTPESAAQYDAELKAMVEANRNSPSIVVWVPFNEGWGQFDTARVTTMLKELDPTRLVDSASGWTDRGTGDLSDWHVYPGPGAPPSEATRASVLGEFGGLGLPLKGHTWQSEKNWGYRSFSDQKSLSEAFVGLFNNIRPLIAWPGLCAAVYTQTTDVEVEVNGLMTYDREVLKVDEKQAREAIKRSGKPVAGVREVVPTALKAPVDWSYTTDRPADDWFQPAFDDSAWAVGPAGFGTEGTPGAVVRTKWDTSDIWIRRTFEVPRGTKWANPHLMIHHDEGAEVYIDGALAANLPEFVTGYVWVPIKAAPKAGKHTLAVHCHQTKGGQYIDLGLADIAKD